MSDVFDFSATPPLHFGEGKIALLEKIAKGFGSRILLVRGGKSFDHNPQLAALPSALRASGFACKTEVIDREQRTAHASRYSYPSIPARYHQPIPFSTTVISPEARRAEKNGGPAAAPRAEASLFS